MKLTTKRDFRYFWRELFTYMIPMILIAGSIDVFYNFMRCPLHPEWSAPCSLNWILAAMYGIFLLITIILAIISKRKIRNIKKQIENEFTESVDSYVKSKKAEEEINKNKEIEKNEENTNKKESKPKKIIIKKDKKSEKKDTTDKKFSKKTTTKKITTKKSVAKK